MISNKLASKVCISPESAITDASARSRAFTTFETRGDSYLGWGSIGRRSKIGFAVGALASSLLLAGDGHSLAVERLNPVDNGPRVVTLAELINKPADLLSQPILIQGESFSIKRRQIKFLPARQLQSGELYDTVIQTTGLLTDKQHHQLMVVLDGDLQGGDPDRYSGPVTITGEMVRKSEMTDRDAVDNIMLQATAITAVGRP